MSTFQRRTITAVIFAAIMLLGVFGQELTFKILFGIITLGCLWEFLELMLKGEQYLFWRKILGILIGITPFIFVSFGMFGGGGDVRVLNFITYVSLTLGFVLTYTTIIIELFLKSERPFLNIGINTLGLLYIGIPFALLIHLCYLWGWFNTQVPAGILFLTWTNDSGAYLVGSIRGKTPFFPRHSPKKTWEGTIGGVVLCLIFAFVLSMFFKQLSLIDWLFIAVIVGVFGTLGDLVESMLKRSVGVKDSGKIMPGHGGFLDRFDAFLFSIPFVFVYLMFRQ
jgi:phosphatidate cytidylyltransferase